jgi:putative transcriptional regulator
MPTDDDIKGADLDLDLDVLLALVDDAAAPASVLQALLQEVAGPWWAPFVRRGASLLDVDADTMGALFSGMDDVGRWMQGPGDGIDLFHIDAGPAVAGAITGFVRLAPGATFPHHRHVGFEDVVVLQGSFFDDGVEVFAGMEAPRPPSSAHAARAGVNGCVYLAVSRDGLAFDGEEPIGPDDPRA